MRTESGVSGDGFTIMVQPAASAAPALRRIILASINTVFSESKQGVNSRNRKIPWHESDGDTNGLFDGKDSSVRSCWNLDSTLDSLCLASEPPGESSGVVNLTL